jgi:Transposase DNA-binding
MVQGRVIQLLPKLRLGKPQFSTLCWAIEDEAELPRWAFPTPELLSLDTTPSHFYRSRHGVCARTGNWRIHVSWFCEDEMATLDLEDRRWNRRQRLLLERPATQPGASSPAASGEPAFFMASVRRVLDFTFAGTNFQKIREQTTCG